MQRAAAHAFPSQGSAVAAEAHKKVNAVAEDTTPTACHSHAVSYKVIRPLLTGFEVLCAQKSSFLCLVQVNGALYVHPSALEVSVSVRRRLFSFMPAGCVHAAQHRTQSSSAPGKGQETGPSPVSMQHVFWDVSQAWGCHKSGQLVQREPAAWRRTAGGNHCCILAVELGSLPACRGCRRGIRLTQDTGGHTAAAGVFLKVKHQEEGRRGSPKAQCFLQLMQNQSNPSRMHSQPSREMTDGVIVRRQGFQIPAGPGGRQTPLFPFLFLNLCTF